MNRRRFRATRVERRAHTMESNQETAAQRMERILTRAMEKKKKGGKMKGEIIIFGLGGVGSWLAEWLVRQHKKEPLLGVLTLVDHDRVEEKNLTRQNYTRRELGSMKTYAMRDRLKAIGYEAIPVTEKIEIEEQLMKYRKDALAVITTDNQASKNMIAKYFDNFLISNCDYDFAEIKDKLDNSDLNTWQISNGYGSQQDIQSNIRAAQLLLTSIIEDRYIEGGKIQTKVQTEKFETEAEIRERMLQEEENRRMEKALEEMQREEMGSEEDEPNQP